MLQRKFLKILKRNWSSLSGDIYCTYLVSGLSKILNDLDKRLFIIDTNKNDILATSNHLKSRSLNLINLLLLQDNPLFLHSRQL